MPSREETEKVISVLIENEEIKSGSNERRITFIYRSSN
jgi:hypothetical protein